MKRHELPLLAGIAGFIRWIEELANLISGPLLTLGLGIALIDLLTEGKLLASLPALLFTWAITQAIGVDAQLVATWDRARIALREHRYWALCGLVVLGLILAYVAWIAAQVFALQQSEGISTAAALTRLGLPSSLWLIQRTALSVFLVCLSGWTRYHAPAPDVAADTEAERARLEASLTLEPLRQQLRASQVRGLRGLVASAAGKETPHQDAPVRIAPERVTALSSAHQDAPTRPPKTRKKSRVRTRRQSSPANVVRMPGLRNPSVEEIARQAWQPGMSIPALQKAAGISRPSAEKYHAMFTAETLSQEAAQ